MSEEKKATKTKVQEVILTDGETGTRYTLDFNLESIAFIQERGFDWDYIVPKSAIMFPLIFWGAFRRYHKNISKAQTDKILENMGGLTEELVLRLRELWEQALSPLMQDDEDKAKNSKWTVEM